MGTIHNFVAFENGGLRGIQTNQRDWSPFVAHFTSYREMDDIRRAIGNGARSAEVAGMLSRADERSAEVAKLVAESRTLRAANPSNKKDLPACVCFSECSLPGLLGHCERYGRFGWVFRKEKLFERGARPCTYVSRDEYEVIRERGQGKGAEDPAGRLFGLSNLYRPPFEPGARVQDYTHEREWRLFGDLDLAAFPPEVAIAPRAYADAVRAWFPEVPHHFAIDLLHEWGL